jgi:phthiocerol/phenolphthiocerol synthesis type-I polyketide synthase D
MDGMTAVDVLPMGKEEMAGWLTQQIASALGVVPDEIEVTAPFASLGISSISGVTLAGEVSDALGVTLPATLFWDYPTIEKLAGYLAGLQSRRAGL